MDEFTSEVEEVDIVKNLQRSPNAYILFAKKKYTELKQNGKLNAKQICDEISKQWKNMSTDSTCTE